MPGGAVMRHRLHQPDIDVERVFDQILAVAGGGAALDGHAVAEAAVDSLQLLQHHRHRVALVAGVVGIEQPAVRGDQRHLGGGGSGVYAEIGVAGVAVRVHGGRAVGGVPRGERLILRVRREEGGHGVGGVFHGGGVLDFLQQLLERHGRSVSGVARRAHGDEHVGVVREHRVLRRELQGVHEPLPQTL